jgi:hypothetical protein
MKYVYLPYNQFARKVIEEGDVLLFRGTGLVSYIIKKAGRGLYSHAALASWQGEQGKSLLECVEFREWHGSRTVSLSSQVNLFSGYIDVYRPCSQFRELNIKFDDAGQPIINEIIKTFNGRAVTDNMRELTGLVYGWDRIFAISTYKLPFLRLFAPIEIDDETRDLSMVCSTSIAYLFRQHYTDLVRFKPDTHTEPSDLARSPILNYLFTLEKDW